MSGIGNPVTFINTSGDNRIDGILTDYKWSDATIYYSFPTTQPVYNYSENSDFVTQGSPVTAQQQDAINFALNTAYDGGGATTVAATRGFAVEGFTALSITLDLDADTTDREHIRFANTSATLVPTARVADFPSNDTTTQLDDNGDVWFGGSGRNPTAGNYDWATTIHEIGHALGLSHGHSTYQKGVTLPFATDSMEYSIMTYKSYVGASTSGGYTNETWGYAQTWMMYDIAALQYMYGANFTTNSGNTTYKWNPGSGDTLVNGEIGIDAGGNVIFATIWDGGGTDTYDLSSYTSNLTLDLTPGGHSVFDDTQLARLHFNGSEVARGSIFNALQYQGDARSLIENATGGSGNDMITGNAANNILTGNDGNDTLTAAGGVDTMYGGNGDDVFEYTASETAGSHTGALGSELISGGDGHDKILLKGAGIFNFGNDFNVTSVEEIEFQGIGPQNKTLRMGNKELDGSTEFLNVLIDGNDTANSNDTIIIDINFTDNLTLAGWTFQQWRSASEGANNTDRIYIYGNANANVVTGSSEDDLIYGFDGNDNLMGGAGNDYLSGGNGNDTLVGGAGVDTLNGFAGNDHITSDGDGGVYNGGSGNDTMLSGIGGEIMDGGSGVDLIDHRAFNGDYEFNMDTGGTNFGGESYLNFENVLMGNGDDTVMGNASNNNINGGGGIDRLSGGDGNDTLIGGAGTDILNGGNGNDTFLYTAADAPTDVGEFIGGGDGDDRVLLSGAGLFDFGNGFNVTSVEEIEFAADGSNVDKTLRMGNKELDQATEFLNVHIDGNSNLGSDDTIIIDLDFGADLDLSGWTFQNWNSVSTGANNVDRIIVYGDARDNNIVGSSQDDRIRGGLGNDVIDGGGMNDRIYGDDGNDTLTGGAGVDTLWGGKGNDHITSDGDGGIYRGFGGNDLMFSGLGNETMTGNAGRDTIDHRAYNGNYEFNMRTGLTNFGGELYKKFEAALMGEGDDTVFGSFTNDRIEGNGGKDRLFGKFGNDILLGGDGVDRMFGGAGHDTLNGGTGRDYMKGGGGMDTFWFTDGSGQDTVADMTDDVDTLNLDGALWGGGLTVNQVINNFASIVGADVVFNFGGGNILTLDGYAPNGLASLNNDIVII